MDALMDGMAPAAAERIEELKRHYREAALDYSLWSPEGNMHFGLLAEGIHCWDRAAMLEAMNHRLGDELGLQSPSPPQRIVDLGCGVGATLRNLRRRDARLRLTGVSCVPEQLETARLRSGDDSHLRYHLADYRRTGLHPDYYDAAYGLESFCHDDGAGKGGVIAEAARLLRPGGRLVIAEAMLRSGQRGTPLLQRLLAPWCAAWCVPEFTAIDAVLGQLDRSRFTDIEVTDLTQKVIPSLLHAPFLVCRRACELLTHGESSPVRWAHLQACLLSVPLGLQRRKLGYFLIRAVKRG
ncbi:MAG: hypothetical protein RL095_1416 [Verrucomicrobiota bacterium]|jgi:SAM-dependent methyltransferase